MTVEILLLANLGALTLLAYMIAINAHGPTRLSFSYLIATLILAGTVYAVVQHVNTGLDQKQMAEFRRLEREKMQAEEQARSQQQKLKENKQMLMAAAKLNETINRGTGLATTIMNADLRDFSVELDVLIGRAAATGKKVQELQKDFSSLALEKDWYSQSRQNMVKAFEQLESASQYYSLYFRSEDQAQEQLREKVMRQRAREAYELLKKASSEIATSS
ncbi:MAG: hypothetical protein ACOC4C_00385 [Fibrobacterota bacterium]